MRIMKSTNRRPYLAASAALLVVLLHGCGDTLTDIQVTPPLQGEPRSAKVVFLAGPDSHSASTHEHRAGSELLAAALRKRTPTIETVNVYGGWPADTSVFSGADAIVMYCDGGRSHLINDQLDVFNELLNSGMGVAAIHYCVEVPRDSPASSSMLRAIGAYFETWRSVNPIWDADFFTMPTHPVAAGITPFRLKDEWYFNLRFAKNGVTPILSAVPPASTMARWNGPHSGNDAVRTQVVKEKLQVTAWVYERPGGGRGFGYTGGHFHANWDHPQARELVLNGIEWVAFNP